MKRHESLVQLSRDHHFGLIMAQRLILGRATNPRADWPTDRAQQAARLVEFFKSDLRAHFDIEETHVFPAAGRSMADGDRQVEALIADHDAMRAMIRSLEADPASGLDERLPAFGHLLKAHIHPAVDARRRHDLPRRASQRLTSIYIYVNVCSVPT